MIDQRQLNQDFGWTNLLQQANQPTTSNTSTGQTSLPTTQPQQLVSDTQTGGTMANTNTGFQYPSQWGQANDVWSQMASGNYSNQGMDWLRNMMQSGGSPVDVNAWGAAQRPAMMDQFSNMVKQMAEQAGVGGTRYSSGLQGQIANYGGQLQNQFTSGLADRWLQSQEAGMGRASGAGSLLAQLGLGTQQAGAEGLRQSGWDYSNLPMQVANQMAGLGGQLTQQQIDPWTQMLAQLLGPTGQATPQQYTPNTLQQMLMGLGQTLPTDLSNWDAQGWWG